LQITGSVENLVPLHVDIPRTGGRGSDLPFEVVLQEYFPTNIFSWLFYRSGVTVAKHVPAAWGAVTESC
jgi:hypothetical protein